ncbi:hypothetical protein AJ79_05113 [Helicocarpus griseus UAMH5409]|uniref:Aminoglycoside phosphotransferase domain-containing protein n=1 Tax=Helicocarpus griseus UAMH5409 TaxID=1447875 RepID=A0A2B7XQM6_9EURO|nr:hypothetical protein AJ79_05113 [Helicocarpus griseus UAMH5409]
MSARLGSRSGAFITAEECIYSAKLSAFEQLSLVNFLDNSRVPDDAGQYMLDRISQNQNCAVEETLRSIRADLKTLALKCNRADSVSPEINAALRERDDYRCCITGLQDNVEATYIIAPSIVQDPDLIERASLRLLLEAILTKDGVEELFSLLKPDTTENQLQNLWLMSHEVRTLFRGGHIHIIKSPCLEGTNGLVKGLGLFNLIDRQADRWNPEQKGSRVKSLPLGLCLKRCRGNTENEANALRLIEKNTSINAPKLIGYAVIDKKSGFLLMTKLPGIPLSKVYYRTTYEEREKMAKNLADWISQLRRIPNKSGRLIANVSGGPITDHMSEPDQHRGPYNSVEEFNDDLTQKVFNIQEHKSKQPIATLYRKKYDVCFTHSDLHNTNILVQNGQLSGLIDWENAGFKPEYWEFVRAMWPYGGDKRLTSIFRMAFGNKYDAEWEAEVFILDNSPFIF